MKCFSIQHLIVSMSLLLCQTQGVPALAGDLALSLDLTNPDRLKDALLKPYMIKLRQKIQAAWAANATPSPLEVQIHFEIGTKGELNSVAITRSSRDENFDKNAKWGIETSAPFNTPPQIEPLQIVATFNGRRLKSEDAQKTTRDSLQTDRNIEGPNRFLQGAAEQESMLNQQTLSQPATQAFNLQATLDTNGTPLLPQWKTQPDYIVDHWSPVVIAGIIKIGSIDRPNAEVGQLMPKHVKEWHGQQHFPCTIHLTNLIDGSQGIFFRCTDAPNGPRGWMYPMPKRDKHKSVQWAVYFDQP